MHVNTAYLVYATPRSGSYLLCEALTNTNLAGHPAEYFGPYQITTLSKRWDFSNHIEYLSKLLQERATPNGIFGAKITWRQFLGFIESLQHIPGYEGIPVPDLMSTIFPNLHYIWITRRDKLRQAISYWKALQTGAWTLSKGQQQTSIGEPTFDFGAINELIRRIVKDEADIQQYFSVCHVQPFTVLYEELVTAYEETAIEILKYLNVQVPKNLVFAERKLVQQTDAQSEEWIRQYRGRIESRKLI